MATREEGCGWLIGARRYSRLRAGAILPAVRASRRNPTVLAALRIGGERLLLGLVLGGWAACSVYDRGLIDQAHGAPSSGGNDGSGATAAAAEDGSGALGGGSGLGGAFGGAGTTTGTGGMMSEAGQTAAAGAETTGGAGNGGRSPGAAGAGAGRAGGGRSGAGGAGRSGGSAGQGLAGEAEQAGEGGAVGCTAPPGCACDATEASCEALVASLVHRYPFDGAGTLVTDVKGGADGDALGAGVMLSGDGTLVLAGGGSDTGDPEQYVALPSDCLSGLTNVTLEAWFSWTAAGLAWERIFDFGQASDATTGTTLWFSPQVQNETTGTSRASYGATGYTDAIQVTGPAMPAGSYHVDVVVDDDGNMLSLYVNGAFAGAQAYPSALSELVADNCWLGRSNFAGDPYFGGTLDEFRVYDRALSAPEILFSEAAGPNPAFF
jgi:hypothetical protein